MVHTTIQNSYIIANREIFNRKILIFVPVGLIPKGKLEKEVYYLEIPDFGNLLTNINILACVTRMCNYHEAICT